MSQRSKEWALCGIFFASGATALLFETLWFRLAGLTFGNSVLASSVVLAAFMAGLGLGNGLAARYGPRIGNPVRAYAALELVIGATGLGLVLAFPALSRLLGPRLASLLERPWLLNELRLLVAFALLLVPTTAMGATLPLLVRVLARGSFGRALGQLYGWNTLGAVAGALAGELWLISRFGMRGTAMIAASVNLAAALAAAGLGRLAEAGAGPEASGAPRAALGGYGRRLLLAAFLAGGILLAAEVVWFRLLLLFFTGTSLAFALMLAVVLSGISAGGFAASWWLKLRPGADRYAAFVALGQGCLLVLAYASFDQGLPPGSRQLMSYREIFIVSMRLMFPVSLLSGALFALLGEALRKSVDDHTTAAGMLTLANTFGAMCGAILGGVAILPALGVERGLFLLACGYGLVALCALPPAGDEPAKRRRALRLAFGALLQFLVAFPFGLMRNHFVPGIARRFGRTMQVAAAREGLTETIVYLRREEWGGTHSYLLTTNGFAMSGTLLPGKRYMKHYVYLPMALLPRAERALLICFGVGSTAKALTDEPRFRSIDIVDISKDVLDLSRIVFEAPGSNPLDDPRVRRHIEDGRFFLQTTSQRFDLITGEPPPPKVAGIVNLYSREYFQLVHDRLNEGGLVSYWLPVDQLHVEESKAILNAFCSVFRDCSLWTGSYMNWMMMGSRGQLAAVAEQDARRQWSDPALSASLRAVGFDSLELLLATFMADAKTLDGLVRDQPPLIDDFPHRISAYGSPGAPWYTTLMDARETRARFLASDSMRRIWPEGVREKLGAAFDVQRLLNDNFATGLRPHPPAADLRELLASPLHSPEVARWIMGTDSDEQRLARLAEQRGESGPLLPFRLGLGALAERDFAAALAYFQRARQLDPAGLVPRRYQALTFCLAGRTADARELAREAARAGDPEQDFWNWLRTSYAVP